MKQYRVERFGNLQELQLKAMSFDDAKRAEIKVLAEDDVKGVDKFDAIINDTRKEVACIATKKYALVQHRDFVQQVSDVLSELNLTTSGFIQDAGNKIYVKAFFTDHIIKDDAKGIHLGIRLGNSYDLSRGLSMSLYGMRIVCINQMHVGNLLHVEYAKHVGEINVAQLVRDFISEAMEQSEKFADLVEFAITDSTSWAIIDRIMPELVKVEKHRQAILANLDRTKPASRWALYNAITAYLSHDTTLSISVLEHMENISKKVLQKPMAVLAETYKGKEVMQQ